jgi:transcriptional regulator with XRE-family HTH domain
MRSRVLSISPHPGHGPAPSLGGRLRALRLRRFLTQEELGAASGLARATIRRLEGGQSGRPHMHTITVLARSLGVSPDQLVPDPAELWGRGPDG